MASGIFYLNSTDTEEIHSFELLYNRCVYTMDRTGIIREKFH